MKNYYFIMDIQENEKFYPIVSKTSIRENFVCVMDQWNCGNRKVLSINFCDSKKKALDIAEDWTKIYRQNGTYFYGDFNVDHLDVTKRW